MQSPQADPSFLYHARDSVAAVDALAAAIVHLDLFTSLTDEPADAAAVARRFSLHPRPTDVLCTLLVAQGLITRESAGLLGVSDTAREFLVAGSPFDARAYYAAMAQKPGVTDFLKVLRTGRPANWPGEAGEADWHASMRTSAFAEAFTAAMDCRGRVLAPALAAAVDLAASPRVLDVGGGSGVYSIGLAERFPALQATGLSSRIDVVAADMFTDAWPAGRDVHLFSNVLHDWDEAECRRLLARSASSLVEDGRMLIHDMLLDDDKAGPLWAAEYSVLLSTVTQGRLYSAAEIGGWLAELEFSIVARSPTALGRAVIIATRAGARL